jgi:hypothetical protein
MFMLLPWQVLECCSSRGATACTPKAILLGDVPMLPEAAKRTPEEPTETSPVRRTMVGRVVT